MSIPMFEFLVVETHSFCNRRCRTCIRQTDPAKSRFINGEPIRELMDSDTVFSILDQAWNMGFKGWVCIIYYNEPLLDKRLLQFAEYAKKKGFSFVTTTTNGDCLTRELANQLDGVFDQVCVSVYERTKFEKKQALYRSMFRKTQVLCQGLHIITHYSPHAGLANLIEAHKNLPCPSALRHFIIDYKGEMMQCCFPKGTPILMGNLKTESIENIKPNDCVMTHDGSVGKVSATFKREINETLYNIQIGNYYKPIVATANHPFLTVKKRELKKWPIDRNDRLQNILSIEPHFCHVADLEKGDFLVSPKYNVPQETTILDCLRYVEPTDIIENDGFLISIDPFHHRLSIKGKMKRFINISHDFMWVLGLYLAEGVITAYTTKRFGKRVRGVRFYFGLNHDEPLLDKLRETIKNVFGLEGRIHVRKQNNNLIYEIPSRPLGLLFKTLCGTYAHKKEIHPDLLTMISEKLLSLVIGFRSGDGYIEEDRWHITTASEVLANQMFVILLNNSIVSSICKVRQKNRKDGFAIYVYNRHLTRRIFDNKKHVLFPIKKISIFPFKGDIYNLEVMPNHTYLVNGLFSVHNCEDLSGNFKLGNVHDTSLEELWFGKKHIELVQALQKPKGRLSYPYCSICPIYVTVRKPRVEVQQ